MTRLAFILFAFALFFPCTSFADAKKASELALQCDVGNKENLVCVSYIRGALETIFFYENSKADKTICFPKAGITPGEAKEVFLKYYNANKALAQSELASQILYAAVQENYSCKDVR